MRRTLNEGTILALQSNASSTGSGETLWPGGTGMFTAEATWGGGTVTLQVKSFNGTWIAVGSDTTMTANGAARFTLPKGVKIRAAIATATAVYAAATVMSEE